MIIGQTPCFSLKEIIKKGKTDIDVYPLNSKNCYFFFSARYAIWTGLKVLGITSEKNILMPSYNCGTEIDPLLDRKIQVKYYEVKTNFEIDIDDMIRQIDTSTAAILVTHYLGFPQPIDKIREICNTKKLFLIEDCAHAFLTTSKSKNVGMFGDISVFSIRKTLPIPNGGALVINNENFKFKEKQIKSSPLSTFFMAVELLKGKTQQGHSSVFEMLTTVVVRSVALMNEIFKVILRVLRKLLSYKGLALIHVNYYEFERELAKWKMSTISERIIRNINYKKIKEKRRKNYEYLLMKLTRMQDIEVVFNTLPEGVCPLFFPIIVKDRQYYYQKFIERGIKTHQYWKYFHDAVPWDKFPKAVFLKNHVLGLPIHQDINFDHLDRMIEVFKDTNNANVE
jgi:perosamine synthetase